MSLGFEDIQNIPMIKIAMENLKLEQAIYSPVVEILKKPEPGAESVVQTVMIAIKQSKEVIDQLPPNHIALEFRIGGLQVSSVKPVALMFDIEGIPGEPILLWLNYFNDSIGRDSIDLMRRGLPLTLVFIADDEVLRTVRVNLHTHNISQLDSIERELRSSSPWPMPHFDAALDTLESHYPTNSDLWNDLIEI